jgi:hypothetical protein
MNIKDLSEELQRLNRAPKFVGIDYVTKDRFEKSRFTLLVGASYLALVKESITEIDIRLANARGIEKVALKHLKASFEESLNAAAEGRPHVNDTKPNQYVYIRTHNGVLIPGIRINLRDGTAELAGRVHSRVVLEPGEPKPLVKHRSIETALRAKLRKEMPIHQFVTLAIDPGHFQQVRINRETLDFT